jgi:HD-GYP domain-containing protein (c-di-GMP phosphodiesterase class II)
MHKKAVAVGDLRFGMYIAELDRPWTETPFMFQGFYLSTERQLEALRRLCRHVFVDVARSTASAPARPATPAADLTIPGFRTHGNASYPAQSALKSELRRAAGLYVQALKALRDFAAPLAQGGTALDGTAVNDAVKGLADSVVRNPDALLLMGATRETSIAAHARALQVAIYMMVFGRFLQLEREQIHLLGLLGLLQDIGMTRLPAQPDEEVFKKHVELSAHILGVTSGLPPKLPALAMLHHERQDGSGYPRGLKGYQIGLYGSIAALCDAYDALLAPPPHGQGRPASAAVSLLLKDRGSVFHGPLVEQFIRCVGSFPIGSAVELNSGELGVVVGDNPMQRLKPKVIILRDAAGAPVSSARIIDLAAHPEGAQPYRIRCGLEQGRLPFDPGMLFA